MFKLSQITFHLSFAEPSCSNFALQCKFCSQNPVWCLSGEGKSRCKVKPHRCTQNLTESSLGLVCMCKATPRGIFSSANSSSWFKTLLVLSPHSLDEGESSRYVTLPLSPNSLSYTYWSLSLALSFPWTSFSPNTLIEGNIEVSPVLCPLCIC